MKRKLAVVILFFSLVLLHAPTLVAQSPSGNQQPATAPASVLQPLTLNQWVRADQSGTLSGRVILPKRGGQLDVLKHGRVAILSIDGEMLQDTTDGEGRFLIAGIKPGLYAMTARGDNFLSCCALHVIEASLDDAQAFPTVAEVSVAAIDPTIVNTAIIRYVPPINKLTSSAISAAEVKGLADQVLGAELFRVTRTEGGMKGRLHLAGSDLKRAALSNVFVFDGGIEVGRAVTDENGDFVIESLLPGVYSLMAIGQGGLGLASFELVDKQAPVAAAIATTGERLVLGDKQSPISTEFSMQVSPVSVDAIAKLLVADPDEDEDKDKDKGEENDKVGDKNEQQKDDQDPEGLVADNRGTDGYFGQYNGSGRAGSSGGGGGGGAGGDAVGPAVMLGTAAALLLADDDDTEFFRAASPVIPVFGN